jgi:hypothetical protein
VGSVQNIASKPQKDCRHSKLFLGHNPRKEVKENSTIMKTTCLFALSLLAAVQVQAAEDICRDEPYYRNQLHEERDCRWVVEFDACSQMDNENVIGDVYCPVSCNSCLSAVQESTVSTKQCYEYGDVIEASFTNSSPEDHDWIALYQDDTDLVDDITNLGQPSAWVWLCGNQHDKCKVSYGSFSFGKDVQSHGKGAKSWPLDPGMYKAVLARRNIRGGPYPSYAMSESFEIKEYGQPCLDEAQQ